MRHFIHIMASAAIAVAALAVSGCSSLTAEASPPTGGPAQETKSQAKEAPAFTAKGSDGKEYTLASLSAKGPVALVFIHNGCGLTPSSFPVVNRLGKAHMDNDKATVVGVIDADMSGFAAWKAEFDPSFVFLLDPSGEIVKPYGVKRSNETVLVVDGKIAAHNKGYSKGALEGLDKALMEAGNMTSKADFTGAPEKEQFG